ncbi:MAG: DUF5348 domain-containing protein [Cellulosilyticaceae bacterium]
MTTKVMEGDEMKQGMLFRNEQGYFALDEEQYWEGGEPIVIFEEDDNAWLEGTVEQDEFGEYYFTNGFLVVYLYEGLPAQKRDS